MADEEKSGSWEEQNKSCSDSMYWFLKYSDFTSSVRNSTYPVKTVIENPVLAWFNLLGKISLFVYLVYMFINESLYYKLSVPKVHTDYWADRGSGISHEEDDYVYCNNDTYDFIFSAGWEYTDNKCTWLEYSESYKKGDANFFFFVTYFQETTRAIRVNCSSDDDIFDDLGLSYENCTKTTSGWDTICDCTDSENYFAMGAENTVFAFSLSYFVTDTQVGGITGESNVKIIILGPDGNTYKKISTSDVYIMYTVEEYLLAAGISLDDYNFGATVSDGTSPHYRISGVTLILSINFYNMLIYHGVQEWSSKTVGVLQVRPEKGWSSMGSSVTYHEYPDLHKTHNEYYFTDRYKYGVKFIFYHGGSIGHWDKNAIQSYFITSIVLFAVIPAIVAKMGILLFGFNSKIYGEQLKRHPDGIIRDMQHFMDTFNYLFNDYELYNKAKMGGESSDWCCCRVLWNFYHQKKDKVTKEEWDDFCRNRLITEAHNIQMWLEINNNPYLARKNSFSSKTLWEAVRKNYDKVSGRLDTDFKTLIRQKWKSWDLECHEENIQRHQAQREKLSERSSGREKLCERSSGREKLSERSSGRVAPLSMIAGNVSDRDV